MVGKEVSKEKVEISEPICFLQVEKLVRALFSAASDTRARARCDVGFVVLAPSDS